MYFSMLNDVVTDEMILHNTGNVESDVGVFVLISKWISKSSRNGEFLLLDFCNNSYHTVLIFLYISTCL